jgi:hypothetical protein
MSNVFILLYPVLLVFLVHLQLHFFGGLIFLLKMKENFEEWPGKRIKNKKGTQGVAGDKERKHTE